MTEQGREANKLGRAFALAIWAAARPSGMKAQARLIPTRPSPICGEPLRASTPPTAGTYSPPNDVHSVPTTPTRAPTDAVMTA